MEKAVAVRAGHARVQLGEHDGCRLDRCARGVDRRTERAPAVLVGRRDLDERHVWSPGVPQQGRDFRQEDRQVVDPPPVQSATHVAAHEEVRHSEAGRIARLCVTRGAERVQVDELDVGELVRPLDQRVQ